MAHAGKRYPVLFRRDWNLNVRTNRTGFANRYIVNPQYGVTGFGTLPARHVFQCGPATENPQGTMEWMSDVYHSFAFAFQIRLAASFQPNGWVYHKVMETIEQHVGVIARMVFFRDEDTTPGFISDPSDEYTYFDPDFYDGTPFGGISDIKVKTWGDGPPH